MSITSSQPLSNRYFLLILLLGAYILSFIDRNIMAILVEPIRAEFQISDFEYGLLNGLAFTFLYAILGVPIGWLADRKSRKNIIALGTSVWSVMTFLCGLATGFYSLFLARIGVGVGEAALSPPAHSLLADYFDKKALPSVMAIFTLGIPVGVGISYSLGGWIYGILLDNKELLLNVFGGIKPWQATFMLVGLPGLLVAACIFFMVEPKRQGLLENKKTHSEISLSHLLDFLWKHKTVYASIYCSIACLAIMGYGFMMWFVAHMSRVYHVESHIIGKDFGLMYLVFGTLGTLFGALLSTFLTKRGYTDAGIRTVFIVAVLWLLPAIAAPLMPTLQWAFILSAPCIFLLNAYFGVAIAALQLCTPNQMRAQASAMLLLMGNIFGLAVGPAIIGLLSDRVFEGEHSLAYALSTVAAIFCPLAIMLVYRSLKPYQQLLAKADLGWG
jgi:MFS family permease